MKIRKVLCWLMLSIIFMVHLSGCVSYQKSDGSTGYKLGVTPETHEKIAKVGETATGILGALSAFFPVLAPVAVGAGVGTATWKKMKKDVTKFEEPMTMYVKVLEKIKQSDQATWDKIKAELKQEYPGLKTERTIDEIKSALNKANLLYDNNVLLASEGNTIQPTDSTS